MAQLLGQLGVFLTLDEELSRPQVWMQTSSPMAPASEAGMAPVGKLSYEPFLGLHQPWAVESLRRR